MKVKYFADTDTALVEFTENEVAQTREISENIYVDLDSQGNLVSMTIEHARTNARLQEFSYQEVAGRRRGTPNKVLHSGSVPALLPPGGENRRSVHLNGGYARSAGWPYGRMCERLAQDPTRPRRRTTLPTRIRP